VDRPRLYPPPNRPTPNSLSLAIIIPAHRDGAPWRSCLRSLKRLDPPPAELIVVDDGGPSSTVRSAVGEEAITLSWKGLTTGGGHGPAFSRNRGAAVAVAEVLLFLDSDVLVPPDLVQRVWQILAGPTAPAGVFGSYDTAPAEGLLSDYRNLLHHYTHQRGRREAFTFWAGCGAIRRSAFVQVGGFDERYRRASIEDIELGYRLRCAGHRILLSPELQVTHLKRWRLGELLRTDTQQRARPWTLLVLQRGQADPDLNLRWTERLSAAALLGALGASSAALLLPRLWWLVLALLVGLLIANLDFYRFLTRQRGIVFAMRAIPLHGLYFLCAASGAVLGAFDWVMSGLRRASADRLH